MIKCNAFYSVGSISVCELASLQFVMVFPFPQEQFQKRPISYPNFCSRRERFLVWSWFNEFHG